MSARDFFHEAGTAPTNLFGREARVTLIRHGGSTQRVWFGFDKDNLALAYFETELQESVNFSVSEAILVHKTLVEDEVSEDRLSAIKIHCLDPKLTEVFYGFMDDLLERVETGQLLLEAIAAASSDWRSLLQIAKKTLTENQALGLYGELCFLEELTQKIGPKSVETWQRSSKYLHDFVGAISRVEVKCSSFQDRASVTIHGLRQLEPPADASLTLAVAEVQKYGEETIDKIVDRILKLGVDRKLLTEKLSLAGYIIGMPGSADYKFTFLSWRFWDILPETPALNISALERRTADAISSVSYSLNLSSLGDPLTNFDFQRLAIPPKVQF